MKEQEILDYNKRCAEYLNLDRDKEVVIYNMASYCYDQLKFHSDWNWIMDVKSKICKSKDVDEFNYRYDSVAKGHWCSISPMYKNTFDIFISAVFESEKEAVIQVINQFLIWNEKK